MTTVSTKQNVSEITSLIQEAFNGSKYSVLADLIKSTSTYEKHLGIAMANFKTLQGSEKQITWATKIREEKTLSYVYEKTLLIWAREAQKRGEKGLGIAYDFDKKINSLLKENDFIFSASASKIIDNRF